MYVSYAVAPPGSGRCTSNVSPSPTSLSPLESTNRSVPFLEVAAASDVIESTIGAAMNWPDTRTYWTPPITVHAAAELIDPLCRRSGSLARRGGERRSATGSTLAGYLSPWRVTVSGRAHPPPPFSRHSRLKP